MTTEVPQATPAAEAVFGERLPVARAYAQHLAGDGVVGGHIGPREVARLWERHLLNCAVLTDLVPQGERVVDVGSGAGLPGIPMAIRRPDLQLRLVEPMLRRSRFLDQVVAELGLADTVSVVRGRAEEPAVRAAVGSVDFVVARAVAPLDRLVRWCLPLLSPSGTLLALKGASAAAEVARDRAALSVLGAEVADLRQVGVGILDEPTWVVCVQQVTGRRARRRGTR